MTNDAASREAQNAIRFLRTDIDAIDLQLVALLVQRARLAVRIGEIKEYAQLPVVEKGREQHVLERASKLRSEPLDLQGVREIFRAIMLTMRRLQTPTKPSLAKQLAKQLVKRLAKKPAKKKRLHKR